MAASTYAAAARNHSSRLAVVLPRREEGSSSWSSREVIASTFLALAVSGTFLSMGSATASGTTTTTTKPSRIHISSSSSKGGGGGGGGGGHHNKPNQHSFFFGNPSSSAVVEELEEEEAEAAHLVGESYGPPYDVSIRALKGSRLTMEDEYFVANGGRFAAVFDGHGGGGVSQYLRQRLFATLCRHLSRASWELSEDRPSVSSRVAALRSAFAEVDELILQQDALQYQGSTAVAVVVHEDDGHRTLLSANVGDSRAILSRAGKAIDLTRDHKPNDEREKARILGMGETIEWDQYCKVHRVRNLSLSRAIGDRFAKPVVSGQVEIKHYPVMDDMDEFFLLASDGLWDVMSSQDVVSFVHHRLESVPPGGLMGPEDIERLKFARRKNMSHYVATEAIKRGTCDNVCVLIVWLKDSSWAKKQ